jgi:hypothetical protein
VGGLSVRGAVIAGLSINFLSSAFGARSDPVLENACNILSTYELRQPVVSVHERVDPDHVVWGRLRGGLM